MTDDQDPLVNPAFERLVQDAWYLARVLAFVDQTSTTREDVDTLNKQLGRTFILFQRLALDWLVLGCARLVDHAKGSLSLKRIKKVLDDVDSEILHKCERLAEQARLIKDHRDKRLGHRSKNVVEGAETLDPVSLGELRSFLTETVEILRAIAISRGGELPTLEQLTSGVGTFDEGWLFVHAAREARERDELRRRAWLLSASSQGEANGDSPSKIVEALKRRSHA